MGGGGGGGGPTVKDLKKLQEQVRATVEAQGGEKKNAFISFVEEDLDEVNLLRGQAKNEDKELDFSDWSVKVPYDSEKAEYIRLKIRERIRQCSVTIVYVSDATANSAWVNWEIQESVRLGKRVVAVHKGVTAPKRLPSAITENKISVIGWTDKGLAKAIRGD